MERREHKRHVRHDQRFMCNWSPSREDRENEIEAKLEERKIKNFPKLIKDINVQIQDAW